MLSQEILEQYNIWWQTKKIPEKYLYPTKRSYLQTIIKQLGDTQNITSIVGPRRVGKTVLLYQTIEYLLAQNYKPQQIIFFKADDPSIKIKDNLVQDLIHTIEKYLIGKPITEAYSKKNPLVVLIDEIQSTPLWAEYLKKYNDLGYPIKFIISGSASIKITKNTKESLVGRFKEIVIAPLSFREVYIWSQNDSLEYVPNLEAIDFIDVKKIFTKSLVVWERFKGARTLMLNMYEEYLLMGGFPQIINDFYKPQSYDQSEVTEYLKVQVIERVLFRDIPELTGIKNTYFLQQLFALLSTESGSVANLREISRKFSVSFQTVQTHLWYMHESYLISMVRKFSKGGMSQARTQPKIYLTDTGIINALNNIGREVLLDYTMLGKLVETSISSVLRFKYYKLNTHFWRDRLEIDFIVSTASHLLPIEVKYRNEATKENYLNLKEFSKRYNTKQALVITKNEFELVDSTLFIPAWVFTLL
ncbi:ATP-binding protein [Candidatus Microgenomates bacterium]|nr:ATP-binding protein [Candidatus Microgenomates bacterium]